MSSSHCVLVVSSIIERFVNVARAEPSLIDLRLFRDRSRQTDLEQIYEDVRVMLDCIGVTIRLYYAWLMQHKHKLCLILLTTFFFYCVGCEIDYTYYVYNATTTVLKYNAY